MRSLPLRASLTSYMHGRDSGANVYRACDLETLRSCTGPISIYRNGDIHGSRRQQTIEEVGADAVSWSWLVMGNSYLQIQINTTLKQEKSLPDLTFSQDEDQA